MTTYTIVKELRDSIGDVIDSEEMDTFKSEGKARTKAIRLNDFESDKSITYCILIESYLQGCIAGYDYIEHDEL